MNLHFFPFPSVHRFQLTFEGAAGGWFAVHQVDGVGPAAHAFDEVEQVFLVGVGGVTADGGDACFDIVSLVVDLDPATTRAVLLYGTAQCLRPGSRRTVPGGVHRPAWL